MTVTSFDQAYTQWTDALDRLPNHFSRCAFGRLRQEMKITWDLIVLGTYIWILILVPVLVFIPILIPIPILIFILIYYFLLSIEWIAYNSY